ncbi:hypothetical protein PGIGA_G00117910 [Pangasianodon gigas]|uniref:Uncharacterized protein n=1 Tax=Pangasianodon gigas TaxID=30993 RepID=A0ACC5XG25_PANGG|nr:hypothetical protein [Pangasianodon gigas]
MFLGSADCICSVLLGILPLCEVEEKKQQQDLELWSSVLCSDITSGCTTALWEVFFHSCLVCWLELEAGNLCHWNRKHPFRRKG